MDDDSRRAGEFGDLLEAALKPRRGPRYAPYPADKLERNARATAEKCLASYPFTKRKPPRAKRPGGKRANTSAVYQAVEERAENWCECGCGKPLAEVPWLANPILDHFEGRARSESLETCWMLRRDCNDDRTANRPNAREWLEKFMRHCRKYANGLDAYFEAHERASNRIRGMVAIRESEKARLQPQQLPEET
jgi:hypothetical protein